MVPVNSPSVRNYNNVGVRNNGFQYKIMPLSFNLLLRGNSNKNKIDTRCIYKLGDNVTGICIYDNKKHTGKVSNIIYDEITNLPNTIYIIDNKTHEYLALKYKGLKFCIHKNESIKFDKSIYNKLNEGLFDEVDDEDLFNDREAISDINMNNILRDSVHTVKIICTSLLKGKFSFVNMSKLYEILDVTESRILIMNKNTSDAIMSILINPDNPEEITEIYMGTLGGILPIKFLYYFIYLCPYKMKCVKFQKPIQFISGGTENLNFRFQEKDELPFDKDELKHILNKLYNINLDNIEITLEFVNKFPRLLLKDKLIRIDFIDYTTVTNIDVLEKFIRKLYINKIYVKFSNLNCDEFDHDINLYAKSYLWIIMDKKDKYDSLTKRFIWQLLKEPDINKCINSSYYAYNSLYKI